MSIDEAILLTCAYDFCPSGVRPCCIHFRTILNIQRRSIARVLGGLPSPWLTCIGRGVWAVRDQRGFGRSLYKVPRSVRYRCPCRRRDLWGQTHLVRRFVLDLLIEPIFLDYRRCHKISGVTGIFSYRLPVVRLWFPPRYFTFTDVSLSFFFLSFFLFRTEISRQDIP